LYYKLVYVISGGIIKLNRNRIKPVIKHVIGIIALFALASLIIPIPVHRVYNAVEIKLDDPSYLVSRKVEIRGLYHWNILTNDMFEGRIIVPDYELTSNRMSNLYFSDDGWPLEYYLSGSDTNDHAIPDTFFLGRIYSKSWFRQMVITVFGESKGLEGRQGGWSTVDGYCIVPLAKSRNEAMKILLKHGLISEDELH